jgi:hypothetical protein
MRPRFQADENLNAKIVAGLLRREPSLDFQTAKAAKLIGLSALVLNWCCQQRHNSFSRLLMVGV